MSLAIRRRKFPIRAQVTPAILKSIAALLQVLHSLVKRDDTRDFLAHLLSRFTAQQMGALRIRSPGDLTQNFPFCPRLAHLPRKLRTKHHSAFSAGLCASVVLLISSLCW